MNKVYAVFNECWIRRSNVDNDIHSNNLIGLFATKERALEEINRFPDNMFGDVGPDDFNFESVFHDEDMIRYSEYDTYGSFYGIVYVEEMEVQE